MTLRAIAWPDDSTQEELEDSLASRADSFEDMPELARDFALLKTVYTAQTSEEITVEQYSAHQNIAQTERAFHRFLCAGWMQKSQDGKYLRTEEGAKMVEYLSSSTSSRSQR